MIIINIGLPLLLTNKKFADQRAPPAFEPINSGTQATPIDQWKLARYNWDGWLP